MQCPKCQFENPEGRKFCRECGSDLILPVPSVHPKSFLRINFAASVVMTFGLPSAVPDQPPDQKPPEEKKPLPSSDSARKYVTVLFSDMSGYTAMSEKLDPEEVKEIMGKIFGEISKVIPRYEGFIDKFIGDAVMALFGVPHPMRMIRSGQSRPPERFTKSFPPSVPSMKKGLESLSPCTRASARVLSLPAR